MEQPDSLVSAELLVLPPCASCTHPAFEHTGPKMKCRICGDRYINPAQAEDDLPSDGLLGE
jgi:hypothetical protein